MIKLTIVSMRVPFLAARWPLSSAAGTLQAYVGRDDQSELSAARAISVIDDAPPCAQEGSQLREAQMYLRQFLLPILQRFFATGQ